MASAAEGGVAPGKAAAPADPASNPKTQLNNFLQRHLRAMVTKADVTYSVQQYGTQYQATVTLHNLNSMQFAGAVAASVKEAEQNAARIALDHHAQQVAAQAAEPPKKSKKKGQEGSGPPPGQKGINKMILNTALSRILRRPLTKEDITFSSRPVPGGWQATLTMPGLPGHWSGLAWAGEVDNSQKEAEDHAAVHALRALQADASLGPAMANNKKANREVLAEAVPPGVLKGKQMKTCKAFMAGQCKWGDECYFVHGEVPEGAEAPEGAPEPSDLPVGALAGTALPNPVLKPKAKKRAPVGDLPRTRLSDTVYRGVIENWRPWGFGWIEMEGTVEHEAAAKNKGKVYLNKKDWEHEAPPEKDQAVTFTLYADDAGLGAEGCKPAA